jgi:parallel beta-helix repeat protein
MSPSIRRSTIRGYVLISGALAPVNGTIVENESSGNGGSGIYQAASTSGNNVRGNTQHGTLT